MSDIGYELLKKLVDSGRIDEAIRVANAVKDPEKRSGVLCILVMILSQRKRFREALKAARLIDDDLMYARSLSEIIHYLLLLNHPSEALGIAIMIPESQGAFRLLELVDVASRLAESGRVDEVVLALNEALKTLKNLPREELEKLGKLDSTISEKTLRTLTKLVGDVLEVHIEMPKRVVHENEDLEVIIRSNIEVENAQVEFEGLDIEPIRIGMLKDAVIKLRPPFKPGDRRVRVIVSFDILDESHVFIREFTLRFEKRVNRVVPEQ